MDQLAKFHKQHGTNLNRFPSVDKRPLDLYKLKKAVDIRGGFENVCKLKKWAEIGRDLGYSGKIMSSLSTSLKNSYQRWLQPYEEYLRVAKPGVQQQLELEHGGPFTPSSPYQSPMPKTSSNIGNHSPSQAHHASPASKATPIPTTSTERDDTPANKGPPPPPPSQDPAPSRPVASGFTPVNAATGGFTAVNRLTALATANSAPTVKREADAEALAPRAETEDPFTSSPAVNGNGTHAMKRGTSHESGSQHENGDHDDNGRRSKRLKKGGWRSVFGRTRTRRLTRSTFQMRRRLQLSPALK